MILTKHDLNQLAYNIPMSTQKSTSHKPGDAAEKIIKALERSTATNRRLSDLTGLSIDSVRKAVARLSEKNAIKCCGKESNAIVWELINKDIDYKGIVKKKETATDKVNALLSKNGLTIIEISKKTGYHDRHIRECLRILKNKGLAECSGVHGKPKRWVKI